MLDFVERTFDATELERFAFGLSSFRVEAAIGDSVIVLEIGDPPAAHAAPVSVSIYVPDIDDTFARALAAGAHEVSPPTRQPNDERSAAVKDVFGNIWYIATYVAPTYPAIDWDE